MLCDVHGTELPPCDLHKSQSAYVYDLHGKTHQVKPVTDGLTLILNEQFDDAIDSDIWGYRQGAYRSVVWLPTDPINNAYCDENGLVFRAIKDYPEDGYEWSSAFIQSKDRFYIRYGAIEAKIKFSNASKYHATLWTLTQNGFGEIDIAEADSERRVEFSVHFYSQNGASRKSFTIGEFDIDPTKYNVFTLLWDEDYISAYCNNILLSRFDLDYGTIDGYNSLRQNHYIVINTLPFSIYDDPYIYTSDNVVTNKIEYLRVYTTAES